MAIDYAPPNIRLWFYWLSNEEWRELQDKTFSEMTEREQDAFSSGCNAHVETLDKCRPSKWFFGRG